MQRLNHTWFGLRTLGHTKADCHRRYHEHNGEWHRVFGRRLSNVTIGLIGVGRVGVRVINHLQGFDSPKILANDVSESVKKLELPVEWVEKERIFKDN